MFVFNVQKDLTVRLTTVAEEPNKFSFGGYEFCFTTVTLIHMKWQNVNFTTSVKFKRNLFAFYR